MLLLPHLLEMHPQLLPHSLNQPRILTFKITPMMFRIRIPRVDSKAIFKVALERKTEKKGKDKDSPKKIT